MADPFITPNAAALVAASSRAASAPGLDGSRPAGGQSPEQLKALAAQFESMLMSQLMKEMQRSMFENDDEQDGAGMGMGSGPLADTLFAEFSLALSRSGGFGLSSALVEPLLKQTGAGTDVAGNDAATAAPTPAASAGFAAMPGRLTSGYGWRRDPLDGQMRFHRGIDLAMAVGHDVPSARRGAVEFAGDLPGYGLTIVVKHDERTSTRYAHLSEILVKPGDLVETGATIARSGATGRATGPHLHVEVLEAGQPVDPSAIKVQRRVAD